MERRHGSPTTAGIGLLPNTRTGDPWAGQPKYSKGMTASISIIIFLFALASVHSRWQRYQHQRHASDSTILEKATRSSTSGWLARPAAAYRMLAYRRLPSYRWGFLNLRLPVLGATLALSAFMLGFTIWAFVVQPYYRDNSSFGSPPLALRAGMMALGLMPFIYVLGSKVNFISLLTGVSHERLQVYHQWLARFMLFLATVHMIPFIYQPLSEGGAAALREWFSSDRINTTGVIAYVCLFVLSFASMTGIRERCYELFLLIHVPVAILFLGYMFVHCQALLTSWRYLWATAALYMLSVFLRFAAQLQQNSFLSLATCRVEALPGGLTKMTVDSALRWRPGQHVFVRFPGLAPLSAHPFTIVSMPSADDQQLMSTVVLMAKARKGITKRLYDRASRVQAEQVPHRGGGLALSAVLDGPYGQDASVSDHQHVLLLAGGSGITFVLASLLELSWQWQKKAAATRHVHFVWSIRDAESLEWVRPYLVTVTALAPSANALRISIYISGRDAVPRDLALPASWEVHWGTHPDAAAAVTDLAREASNPSKQVDVEKASSSMSSASAEPFESSGSAAAAVVVCGPSGMVKDASNAVADLQADILRGNLAGVENVTLITESFGF
ncbi:Ferric reductase, NAD binding [Kalmanozyma brasiliensis GHG001]|uniref:ferric-chelate reductase (NADPH) n=1 Tax=Kalmanozyma brasiliensis (strain GHG001) TaxID=1365824 RepID=V5GIS9_KALBG|nr:Ferric reductase, NAD binding [Kalmanozyma brasiliensis GHG001]EST05892.1 Ferric reductase, NAD binding [Kalmanozyma brasiliensis GHG001]